MESSCFLVVPRADSVVSTLVGVCRVGEVNISCTMELSVGL